MIVSTKVSMMKFGFLDKYIAFGDYEHTKWVKAQAEQVPSASRVLDVGAGLAAFVICSPL